MQKFKHIVVGALAAAFAVSAFGQPASAQLATIDSNTLGAALVAPWETFSPNQGTFSNTLVTVTNGLTEEPVTLHVTVLSGDRIVDPSCRAINFDCPLTPGETTWFNFFWNGAESQVNYECSRLGVEGPDPGQTNDVFTRSLFGVQGIVFVSLECQKGSVGCPGGTLGLRTRGDNALLADSTVLNFAAGYAYSVGAIHIQSSGANDGDRLYEFDGVEYEAFPSALATNFQTPNLNGTGLQANLILFTVDLKANDAAPINFAVFGDAYDDDENPTSGGTEFDCYFNGPIQQIFGTNVQWPNTVSTVGHLQLFPTVVGSQVDVNETSPITGDANGSRRRPVHGWLWQLQPGVGAWGRTLSQGTNPLLPIGTDLPALNAGPPPI